MFSCFGPLEIEDPKPWVSKGPCQFFHRPFHVSDASKVQITVHTSVGLKRVNSLRRRRKNSARILQETAGNEQSPRNGSGWWFLAFFIFHNIWDNPSHWLIFFRGVETINQWIFEWEIHRSWIFRQFMISHVWTVGSIYDIALFILGLDIGDREGQPPQNWRFIYCVWQWR